MISKIHSTTIVVSDQAKALDFYENTLGWKRSIDNPMGPEMRFLTVAPADGATELVLGLASWAGESSTMGGNTGISLITNDIDAEYQTLTGRGVTFKGPVEVMPWGDKAAWFSDPDGNEFFLVEGK